MKLYHGTNTYINEIDFNKCNPNKDFGLFYNNKSSFKIN